MPAFGRHTIHLDVISVNDPTIADDLTTGIDQGSRWYNSTTAKTFLCYSSAAGAAVWRELTADGQNNSGTVAGGNAAFHGGDAGSAAGGSALVRGGNSTISGAGGAVTIEGGTGASVSAGGNVLVLGGPAATGAGGNVSIQGGAGTSGSVNGGNIVLTAGASVGSGVNGHIIITNIGTADPHIVGALFAPATAGAVSISGG